MLADIRRRFMSKEAFLSPDFPAPDEGNGFAFQPDAGNHPQPSRLIVSQRDFFRQPIRTVVQVPKTELNGIDCRLDKPVAFSGTPSMNDTGCENEQGAPGHVMIECLRRIIREYQNLDSPGGLQPLNVAIGSLPGKVLVVTGVRGAARLLRCAGVFGN